MSYTIVDDYPDDPRAFLPYVEFYITNVCNLACDDCNRFNNHDFRGHYLWQDYVDQHEIWSRHVRFQKIAIMGGEPLLNPSVCDWVDGINRLWNRRVQIMTNGTRLNKTPGLYDRLVRFREEGDFYRGNWLGVSIHNAHDTERYFDEIRQFLQGSVTYYHRDHAENVDNRYTWGATHAFSDSNGMHVHVWDYTSFYPAAVQRDRVKQFVVSNSDPDLTHQQCGFRLFKCHHFMAGKIYKCPPVALFPEFDRQHGFDISPQDRELMHSYPALTVDQAERAQDFFNNIDTVIPQCKFCPVHGQATVNRVLFARAKNRQQGVFR
jgi:hypothetical protein